jgi:hypothetical protein
MDLLPFFNRKLLIKDSIPPTTDVDAAVPLALIMSPPTMLAK